MAKIISLTFVNLVTPKAGAKHDFCSTNRPLESLGHVAVKGIWAHRGVKHVGAWGLQGHIACKGMGPAEAWNMERGAYRGMAHDGRDVKCGAVA
jgi:hypothetical protein